MSLPLSSYRIWITRPAAQAGYLSESIVKKGAEVYTLPLLSISPATDQSELNDALSRLVQFDLAVFISPSALNAVFAKLNSPWPKDLPIAVVGPGSAKRAAELGAKRIICPPTQFDGEGLLQELGAQTGKKIVLFRGNGGRDILPAGLSAAGASVTVVTAYQRSAPTLDVSEIEYQLQRGCDGIVISSSEAAQHLFNWAGGETRLKLQCALYFVPHHRIAEALQANGANHIVQTEAGDDGITQSICRYFAPVLSPKE
ncbi:MULTISPECIES: uroporphyrinogen-III synthase [Deefgea]|uniref:Uroporphyrinogen-III synthase n=1 Tax=Deefgea chitinilytica TaxID=570276 RepID=A0ABS2CG38_9NEIS|nr:MULTISPECIES: uroporphyrinogen-III synthase [Deefgea]MBM5572393.1 uroporphyrinogen-III synthase [Deefgea chitinilytica]MBM9889629.1 uroporphyrinogen-III synthase [Deefgea sp. CFH1-16]